MKHIILQGDPVTGFVAVGPFKSDEDAFSHADFIDSGYDGDDFWIMPLNPPKEN